MLEHVHINQQVNILKVKYVMVIAIKNIKTITKPS